MGKVIRHMISGFGSIGTVTPVDMNLPEISVKSISIEDAMQEDWQRVGGDIQLAMNKFESGYHGSSY